MPTIAPRAYVSEFQIALGPIRLTGKLVKVTRSGSDEYRRFTSVCPDCQNPTPVFQQYVCTADPTHVHPMGELDKAKDIDGTLVRMTVEDIAEAKTSDLPSNRFVATVHPADEVLNSTYDSDNAYLFLPSDDDPEALAMLTHVIDKSGKAFIAMVNLRNNEGLFRLTTWRGYVVVQKLYWPDDCNSFDDVTAECDEVLAAAGQSFVDKITKPFDADEYKSSVKERLLEMEQAAVSGTPVPARERTAAANRPGTLLSLLEAFSA